jgi:hypothetical protein
MRVFHLSFGTFGGFPLVTPWSGSQLYEGPFQDDSSSRNPDIFRSAVKTYSEVMTVAGEPNSLLRIYLERPEREANHRKVDLRR